MRKLAFSAMAIAAAFGSGLPVGLQTAHNVSEKGRPAEVQHALMDAADAKRARRRARNLTNSQKG